jgi:peptidoglycan biosynthesis protein MviN/MurJ (putative lipid II flippase)
MWTPVLVGTATTVLAVPVYIILKELLDIRGIALASTVSIAGYTIVLAVIWFDRTGTRLLPGIAQTVGRALVPAVVAGGTAWLVAYAVQDVAGGFAGAVMQVIAGGLAAAAVFLALAGWMGTMKKVSDD